LRNKRVFIFLKREEKEKEENDLFFSPSMATRVARAEEAEDVS
jgi:hypothetical protein